MCSYLHYSSGSVPLPPPESGTYEKQPGHTFSSLKKAVMSTSSSTNISTNGHNKDVSVTTSASDTSYPPSPTGVTSDWDESAPSTRPHSRAPSFSAGFSGGKLVYPKNATADTAPSTPIIEQIASPAKNDKSKRKRSRNSLKGIPIPSVLVKASSTPPTPALNAMEREVPNGQVPDSATTDATVKVKKPASVHSNDGKEGGHKFNLKDLLASGPKLSRKSSQRSTASSRKSDTDHESATGGYPYSSGPRSTAGESTTSLSKKYGVCQKVAIGKGATSVVRLAHKWDRSEEKLYAVKVCSRYRYNEWIFDI